MRPACVPQSRKPEAALLSEIQNPAALFTTDNFATAFYPVRRLSRDLHVTAGANLVVERHNGGVSFTRK